MRQQLEEDEDYQSRVLQELCSIIIHTLKFSPSPLPFPAPYPTASSSSSSSSSSNFPQSNKSQVWRWIRTMLLPAWSKDSPAAFASLFWGISLALMLFGSVTFLVGLLLLPWVTLLVFFFYLASLFSNFFMLGPFILHSTTYLAPQPSM